ASRSENHMRYLLRTAVVLSASALVLTGCAAGGGGESGGEAGALKGSGSGDSCVIDATVPVGAALSLTGGAASYGESQQKGLELALEHLNAEDGVEYDLTIEDDGTDPRQAISV